MKPDHQRHHGSPMHVHDDPGHDRYLADMDGEIAGEAVYLVRGERSLLVHTEVGDAFEGQGVGSALARHALDDARSRGLLVVPLCPFMAGYIERHPEYTDLVDNELLGILGPG
ncbi:MAG: N-acetyltransferase [Microthrixaceae bacterium]|nr:N-acetyltransferase [Microthrixaceae bacterium]